jgi:uncharacterized protein (DUF1778 family)
MIFLELEFTDRLRERIQNGIDNLTIGELLLLSADSSPSNSIQKTKIIEVSEEDYDLMFGDLENPVEPTEALIELFRNPACD